MRSRQVRSPESSDAQRIPRRLFLGGSFKAAIAAGLCSPLSIAGLLGCTARQRRYDGELIEPSYETAHRMRDGKLEIPSLTPEGPLHDAIVVGSGISGLMAAWDLARGGLEDILIYEKEDYPGGHACKGTANGTDYSRATWSLARPRDRFLTQILSDLDVIESIGADGTPKIRPEYVGPPPQQNILIEGQWYRGAAWDGHDAEQVLPTLPMPERYRRDMLDFTREMLEWPSRKGRDGLPAFAMPVEEASRDAELLELDRITMAEYGRRRGWGQQMIEGLDGWSAGMIGGLASEVSAYAFLSFNSLGQAGEDITLPGGNAWLAERLVKKVGKNRIRTGIMVVRIENRADEIRAILLDPRSGRFSMRRARCAVLACPKHITGRMVPEMRTPERLAYRDFKYGALLMGTASVRHTPVLEGVELAWSQYAEGTFSDGFMIGDYNSERWRQGDPRRPNVLCVYAPLAGKASRAELLEKPWSHWADLMAGDLEFMVPGISEDLTRIDINVWAHHMVIPFPGFLTGTHRHAVCRPLGRITFAHTDRHGMPSFELAARAGHDAARECAEILRGSRTTAHTRGMVPT